MKEEVGLIVKCSGLWWPVMKLEFSEGSSKIGWRRRGTSAYVHEAFDGEARRALEKLIAHLIAKYKDRAKFSDIRLIDPIWL